MSSKRQLHRMISKTNSSSISENEILQLREKISNSSYISIAVEKLAAAICRTLLEGFLFPSKNNFKHGDE